MADMIPVIMSGGAGTRLWPVSRAAIPKQFVELFSESLFLKTLRRLRPVGEPWVVTVAGLRDPSIRALKQEGVSLDHMLLEPVPRNTAAAIALLCRVFEMRGWTDRVVGVFPSDHIVEDEAGFQNSLREAARAARDGAVVTLGIQPNRPATGFGYIEVVRGAERAPETASEKLTESLNSVKRFCEKPDLDRAKQFVAAGNFLWNAGIFVFQVNAMIGHFARLAPETWTAMSKLQADLSNLGEVYAALPSISFDYAIMEKLDQQICLRGDWGWSDLGSWDDLALFAEKSQHSLANHAKPVGLGSDRCFVFSSQEKVIAVSGLSDVIVIDSGDALLVTRRGSTQDVKTIVDQLVKDSRPEATTHRYEIRPWGKFTVLKDEPHFKSKLISVDSGAQISYQSHARRAEHWIIVSGEGVVTLNDVNQHLRAGESIFIPVGAKHRIRNSGDKPLEFIEVQTGSYFGEDDITRYQDDYNRA